MDFALILVLVILILALIVKNNINYKNNKTLIKLSQPIDLRYKFVKGFWGKKKVIPISTAEQRQIKNLILKIFPDNLFYDNLNDKNSLYSPKKESTNNTLSTPINLCYKYKSNISGQREQIPTSTAEQETIKKAFLKIFPEISFYDDLNNNNSAKSNQSINRTQEAFYQEMIADIHLKQLQQSFDNDCCNLNHNALNNNQDDCDCDNHDD